jgi:hypothetical protein
MEQGMEQTVVSIQTNMLINAHSGEIVMREHPLRTTGIGRAQARAS